MAFDRQTQRIDGDVAFAAVDLLARVIASCSGDFGGLDRLAVDDDDRGCGAFAFPLCARPSACVRAVGNGQKTVYQGILLIREVACIARGSPHIFLDRSRSEPRRIARLVAEPANRGPAGRSTDKFVRHIAYRIITIKRILKDNWLLFHTTSGSSNAPHLAALRCVWTFTSVAPLPSAIWRSTALQPLEP
jgi:hypothetical protein